MNSLASAVLTATIVFFAVTTLFVALRFVSRGAVVHRVSLCDYLILLALGFALGISVSICLAATHGLGLHIDQIPPDWKVPLSKAIYAFGVLYVMNLLHTFLSRPNLTGTCLESHFDGRQVIYPGLLSQYHQTERRMGSNRDVYHSRLHQRGRGHIDLFVRIWMSSALRLTRPFCRERGAVFGSSHPVYGVRSDQPSHGHRYFSDSAAAVDAAATAPKAKDHPAAHLQHWLVCHRPWCAARCVSPKCSGSPSD